MFKAGDIVTFGHKSQEAGIVKEVKDKNVLVEWQPTKFYDSTWESWVPRSNLVYRGCSHRWEKQDLFISAVLECKLCKAVKPFNPGE